MHLKDERNESIVCPGFIILDFDLNKSELFLYFMLVSEYILNNEYVFNDIHNIRDWYTNTRTRTTLNTAIKGLLEKNLIIQDSFLTYKEAFKKLNKKNSSKGCLFCGYDKYSLDEHHYPIPKSEGGTTTITLCPNCHRAFHYLTGTFNRNIIRLNLEKLKPYKKEIDFIRKKIKDEHITCYL